jgi:ribulose-phosphate 3-epimerase
MWIPMKIAPSILAADLTNLEKEIRAVEKAGADLLHLDIMDGHFVPNITFGFPVIEKIRKLTSLPLDAHLMIENADSYLEQFAQVGCNWLSVHVEACPHLNRTLQRIKELGMKAGVAINPGTALSQLDAVLEIADFFLIMSVNPGFGGQKFIPGSFERVKELRTKLGTSNVEIQIDGGIKETNARDALAAGCTVLVIGTGLFGTPDYKKTIDSIRR